MRSIARTSAARARFGIIRACAEGQGKALAGFAGQLAVHQRIDTH
jgi:hypothetical protein